MKLKRCDSLFCIDVCIISAFGKPSRQGALTSAKTGSCFYDASIVRHYSCEFPHSEHLQLQQELHGCWADR